MTREIVIDGLNHKIGLHGHVYFQSHDDDWIRSNKTVEDFHEALRQEDNLIALNKFKNKQDLKNAGKKIIEKKQNDNTRV